MIRYDGGCLCGAIRYQIGEPPLTCYVCHCTDCQRRTGSAFAVSLIVRRDAVVLIQGEPKTYQALMADGRSKRGQYCERCATRLWGEPLKGPGIRVVQPGTLDDPLQFAPVAHQWTRSAQPWVLLAPELAIFERQPAQPLEMFRLWQAKWPPAQVPET